MNKRTTMLVAALGALPAAVLLGMGCGSSGASTGSASTQTGQGGASNSNGSGHTTSTGTSPSTTSSGGGGGASCNQYPGQDPSTLPGEGCCTFEPSHCNPLANVPPGLLGDAGFNACSTGVCEPDVVIKAGSAFVPPACTSTAAGLKLAGVCLSQCWVQVQQNPMVGLLLQDGCSTGELCAPCLNPLANNAPTGACDIPELECPALADGGTDGGSDGGSACPYTGPALVDAGTFPECAPACNGAHCVPSALVPAADQAMLATCTAQGGGAGFCAPDSFIETGGNGLPPTCKSIVGAEGRCLSTCIPGVEVLADVLPQDICPSGELCAPCYNPTASDPTAPTGACSLACDKPADPPTILPCPYPDAGFVDTSQFPACSPACAGAHCLPSALVPTGLQSQLATCNGGFCVPDVQAAVAGDYLPPTCTSVAGSEGRCLSVCLPAVSSELAVLPQSTCATGERCAPCYNPTAAGPDTPPPDGGVADAGPYEPTGACSSVACDSPKDPPVILTCPWTGPDVINPATLPTCDNGGCNGAHCLPASVVPTALQSQLAPCDNNTGYCTPDEFISTGNELIPTSCDPFPGSGGNSGAQGRCLSDCLPMIATEAKSGLIVQSTCGTGQLCAPCNDPFTGASTGACTLGCDTPPKTPFTFPKCCNENGGLQGTCVPTALIPTSEQSDVNQSGNNNSATCPTSTYDCVPDTFLPAPYGTKIQGCTSTSLLSLGNECGVCVSACISNAELIVFGADNCTDTTNHCVPCALDGTTPGCASLCP